MSDAVTAEILELEKRRWAALVEGDTATLRELFADRMSYTHSNAMVDSKDSYLGTLADGTVAYTAADVADERVRLFGDTAVVTGDVRLGARAQGRELRLRARYSAVWARHGGRWSFVCWHSTALPE
ncbi:nuclear transport factor 2 family protein [Thermobifida halotolerans]|uniref:Nuclear transport factor 2 family protein n=1 Tax=Thermobifida halotolerans TaxID=483545 RepID=A0A399G417_9ACTN|nr:nuclear transport factor 2 family protein [Thermobifida halotolerans]UOE21238.1 nuclear transport factor 2 family protein [Thermobifida halotolerans]